MKLTFFLTCALVVQASAGTFAQSVTLSMKNASLKTIFKEVKKQTGYHFVYNNNLLQKAGRIDVNISEMSVDEALQLCLKGQPVNFTIIDKTIIIKPVSAQLNITAEQKPAPPPLLVTGKVTDASGNPLDRVTIYISKSNKGTATNAAGEFSIEVSEGTSLVFSFVGYESQTVVIKQAGQINVVLKMQVQKGEEIVVVGYGSQKKKDLTGSVVHTDVKSKGESPAVSLATALQGVVPGLNVGAVTLAGTDPTINIRGRTSISGSNSPLIVLDGIIYRGSLVDINPADIESIDVLKDASATAIYGSQASNGVIIISTKIAKTQRKPTVEYSTSYTAQSITNKKMLPEDGAGFIRRIGDRFLSESRTGADLLTPNPSWDPTTKFFGQEILTGYQKGIQTNWWDLLTNKTPSIQNHNLSISGKNEGTSYLLSAGLTDQKNVVKNDTYKRYNFRINLETRVYSWFKAGVQSFLSVNDYSGAKPTIGDVVRNAPQTAYKDDQGNYIIYPYRQVLNPFLQTDQRDLNKRNNMFANFYADLNVPFIKGLNYRVNFSPSSIALRQYNFNSYDQNLTGSAAKTNQLQYSVTLDHILSYSKTIGLHSITATLVSGSEKITTEGTSAKAIKFANNVLGYNQLSAGQAGLQTTTSTAWQETSLYSMARVGYGYKGRYQFTGTIRRDGFSGFGKNNKFGVFPSAAASWRLSEEKFFKEKLAAIDNLKLRVSYGVSGNRTIGRYQTLSQIQSGVSSGYLFGDGGVAEAGQSITSLPNPDLKWETTKSFNVGIDFSVLRGRLFGNLEYYNAKTYDLLYNVDIPVINGFGSTLRNIGKMNNNGQEFSLTGIPVKTRDFSWEVTGNFSRNRNKIVSILGKDANGNEQDLVSSKLFIGQPYGVVYDYKIIGMWQVKDYNAGNIPAGFTYGTYKVQAKDQNNIAPSDRVIQGYTDPSYRFSIQNAFRYKNFELKMFINSIQGGKKYYYGQPGATLQNPDNSYGWNSFKWDYWTPENPSARYRQIGYYSAVLGGSDFSPYIHRSFVRLQDLTLSYNLPASLLARIKASRAKVYLNGANLLTFTKWDGWDPETGTGLDAYAYPFLKSFTVGINLEF